MKIAFYNLQGGTGKTTLATNFAYYLSQSIKTAYIDCDFFAGTSSFVFNLEDVEHNINTYFIGESTLEDIMYNYDDLIVIPAGVTTEVFQSKFDTEKFNDLLTFLADECEIIVLDLPPNITEDNILTYAGIYEYIDKVLIVSDDSIPGISNTLKTMDLLEDLGLGNEGIIVNKYVGHTDLEEIADDLLGVLPYDINVERQWKESTPIIRMKTKFSKEFKKFINNTVKTYLEKDLASLRALKLAKEIYGLEDEEEL